MSFSNEKHVLVYGDVFVDYIAVDKSNSTFTTFLGGATVNVAAGISRLGASSAYITVMGDDETSAFVHAELCKEGVNLSYALRKQEKRVTGVYVHLSETSERIFHRYVDDTPDIQVESSDLNADAFQKASVFHICSGTMFHPTALATTREAIRLAKAADVLVSFDANIRPLRWGSEEICRNTILSFLDNVDLLKLTDDELFFLTESLTVESGIERLSTYGIATILVTVGENGTYGMINGVLTHVGVEPVIPVDTTGAGDAFIAGILRQIHLKGKPKTHDDWVNYISFGNHLGALCATNFGALSAMPRIEDIEE